MKKRVTMEQIAEAANVSKGLVSRALTDRYGVSNEMRSFIKMKATELGYDFNKIKTKQVRKKKCCILISSRVLTRESYWQPIIRRMEEELSFVGIETHYFVHGEKQFSEDEQKKFREDDSGAYVVISKNMPFLMQELDKKKKPTVVIDPQFHVSTKFMQIKTSNYESSYEAAKYLIENGLKRILYFGSTTFSESFSERYAGVVQCVKDHAAEGASLSDLDIDNSGYAFAAPERLTRLLSSQPVDAVMCCNDLFAVSALKTIREMGMRVPEDISVIGFDNTVESRYVSPGLTTIEVPREKMGEDAAKLIAGAIGSGTADYTSLVLNCKLVRRGSVREKGGQDEEDRKA